MTQKGIQTHVSLLERTKIIKGYKLVSYYITYRIAIATTTAPNKGYDTLSTGFSFMSDISTYFKLNNSVRLCEMNLAKQRSQRTKMQKGVNQQMG